MTRPRMKGDGWDVGIDLDGCVYDFVSAIRKEIFLNHPHLDPSSEAKSWTFYEQWGLSTDEFLGIYSEGVKSQRVLWQGKPIAGSIEGWHQLADAGHRIHIITDRRPPGAEREAQEATLAWLAQHNLPYDSLTFSPDKTLIRALSHHPEKVVFVDDKRENHDALTSAGIHSFLMDRPWNQSVLGERVNSLTHYAEKVGHLSGRRLAQT